MGMRAPTGDERYVEYYQQLQEQTRGLPMTLFVLAAEEVAFRDVLFREPED
jgi:hypothetical protein